MQVLVAERVRVGGVEQTDALIEREADDVDRVRLARPAFRRQPEETEPERDFEGTEDAMEGVVVLTGSLA
ncbi:hypothetical protein OV079_01750 [Nannocystis pusilla]|uniref:Uncharacterized protein n=1 Tax=Nannocystis pusilla TaxID=889268 RepID=A0A9X3ERZ5_9BACT|nr:hypothetical protein [Nannocystis pusilla]